VTGLSHFDGQGRAVMVDVTDKPVTARTATAKAVVGACAFAFARAAQHRIPEAHEHVAARAVEVAAGCNIAQNEVAELGRRLAEEFGRKAAEVAVVRHRDQRERQGLRVLGPVLALPLPGWQRPRHQLQRHRQFAHAQSAAAVDGTL